MRKNALLTFDGGLILVALALILITAMFTSVTGYAQQAGVSGQWLAETHSGDGGDLQLTLRHESGGRHTGHFHSSSESFDIASSKLKGLDPAALKSNGTKSQFELVRDAGTFQCEGWFANRKASGHWTFQPNPQYLSALAQKGIGTPTAEQQMLLALSDTSLELVDVLKQAGYTFDVDQLITTGNHGVDLAYVKGMNQLGYKPETLDALAKMRDHGVDPNYVRELAAAGLNKLPAEQVVKMRDHGVDAEFMKGLAQYGITGLDGEQLARLRDHGVDPRFIAGMKESGVSGSPEELIRLRDHGVGPQYVASLQKSGFKASAEQLTHLRDHGVSPEYIGEVRGAGFTNVSSEELIHLRDHGVNAEYLRQYGQGHSVQEVIHLHDVGVRAEI